MAQLGHNVFTGTNVSDALATNLLTGATLNAAGTTAATAVQIDRPGDCAFVLTTGTVTGTSPVLTVTLTASDDAAFGDDVVTVATFVSTGATEDDKRYIASVKCYKKYIKAGVTVAGTSPVYTGSTLYLTQPHYKRNDDATTSTII